MSLCPDVVRGRIRVDEKGLGLLDVMVAFLVLLVVLVPTGYLIDTVVSNAAVQRGRVTASELADQWLEKMSNATTLTTLQNDISRDVLLTPTPVVIGGQPFSVWSHLEWADTGTSPSLCTSGNPPQVIRATITVKWSGQQMGETSIINPPYGTLVPGDGFLSIQIQGANAPAAPSDTANLINVGVNVTPQGGSTTTYNPDKYGCVYLEEPLGTYSVSLSSPAGGPTFVDWQEVLTPSQPSTQVVTAGLPAFVPAFHFDEAGTVTLIPGGSVPVATGMPISVSNGGNLQPSGTKVIVPAGGTAGTATLFPYSSAYSVWYGDCTTVSGVTQEMPSSPAVVTVTPQGSASVTITGLDTLALAITRSAGAFSAPPTATATTADAAAPGDGCPATAETYGLSAFSGSGSSYSDQTGILAQTYTVKVTDPTNSSVTSFSMQVGASGVVYNSTTYPYGTPVPVTVP